MAKTDVPDDSFIREVDEAYNRDRLATFWARWGRWLIVGTVVLLAALGGWLFWREESARGAGLAGERFAAALGQVETGNAAAAAPALDELAVRDDGYAGMARLTQAATAVQAGDLDRARALYAGLAKDVSQPQPLRDLAVIKGVRLDYDNLPPAEVIARLRTLAIPGSPWFPVAGELTGIAYLKNGQPTLAAPIFASIARDASAPPTLRARAEQLAGSLGVTPVGASPVMASGTRAAPTAPAPASPEAAR